MELKTRYADFFTSSAKPPRSDKPEEEIFVVANNPFEQQTRGISNQLGRSSNFRRPKMPHIVSVPKSTIFQPKGDGTSSTSTSTSTTTTTTSTLALTTTTTSSTSTTTTQVPSTSTTTTTTLAPTTTTTSTTTTTTTTTTTSTTTSTTPPTTTTNFMTTPKPEEVFVASTITLVVPFEVNNPVTTTSVPRRQPMFNQMTVVDQDSGPFSTVRANIFSSPSGFEMIPFDFNRTAMETRARTAEFTVSPLNKEIVPDEILKNGPKAALDKRVGHNIWAHQSTVPFFGTTPMTSTTTVPTTTTSYTTSTSYTTTTRPITRFTTRLLTTQPTTTTTEITTTTKKECKDGHMVCF